MTIIDYGTLFSFIVKLVNAFLDMGERFVNFIQRPLLSPEALQRIEALEGKLPYFDTLFTLLRDMLGVQNFSEITIFWGFLTGFVTVCSVIFIKWILDWIL